MNINLNISAEFWSKVGKTTHCWVWRGKFINDYPVFRLGGRYQSVVRLICEGTPKNRNLTKRCKNPVCINPSHIELSKRGAPPIVDKDPWLCCSNNHKNEQLF